MLVNCLCPQLFEISLYCVIHKFLTKNEGFVTEDTFVRFDIVYDGQRLYSELFKLCSYVVSSHVLIP